LEGFSQRCRGVIVVAKKDILVYYCKGPVVIFGVLFPLFLYLAFTIGRDIEGSLLIPGLLGITLFFSSTSVGPVIAPWETRMKTLERLIASPISLTEILLGDMLASLFFGVAVSSIPFLVGFILHVIPVNPAPLLVGIPLAAFCFSALGILFSFSPTDVPADVMMLSNLVKLPLIFISGVFIPLEAMPGWGKAISYLSPLTYFTEIARYSIRGSSYLSPILSFSMLTIFTAIFLLSSIKLHEWSLPKRL